MCGHRLILSVSWCAADVFSDQKDFHSQHFSTVYKVVLDCLQQFDFAAKTETVALDDVYEVLTVLSRLLPDIQVHLQKRWQARSISTTLLLRPPLSVRRSPVLMCSSLRR